MNKLNKSIERALVLLPKGAKPEELVSIKLEPEPKTCCCFHCWPETWQRINESISPQGPIKDEGDLLVEIGSEKFVLECHETGPELIAFINSSLQLADYIIGLIKIILSYVRKERKQPTTIKILKRNIVGKDF